jgi:hypothetical protein
MLRRRLDPTFPIKLYTRYRSAFLYMKSIPGNDVKIPGNDVEIPGNE